MKCYSARRLRAVTIVRGDIVGRSNPIARTVKLADNSENMELSRIANPTQKDHERLEAYERVREVLLAS
jgi:hypothetical protein